MHWDANGARLIGDRARKRLPDTTEAAEQSLRAVISWARYGEAFAYDADGQMFSLENPS
jgi:NitT/TauT family transport system ATP-binding protein